MRPAFAVPRSESRGRDRHRRDADFEAIIGRDDDDDPTAAEEEDATGSESTSSCSVHRHSHHGRD